MACISWASSIDRSSPASVGSHPMAPSSVAARPTARISVSTRSTGSWRPQPGTSQTPQEIGPPATRSIRLTATIPLLQPGRRPLALERSNSYAPAVALSRVPLLRRGGCAPTPHRHPACWRTLGWGGSAAILSAVAIGCAGAAPADPAASVVAITATGCRPSSNVAHGVVVGDDLVATVAHAVAGEDEILVGWTPRGRRRRRHGARRRSAARREPRRRGGRPSWLRRR